MIKFLVNIMEITFIMVVTWKILRYVLFRKSRGKKTHRKSILAKVWLLVSRYLHGKLDGMIRNQIRRQKENLAKYSEVENTQQDIEKVGTKNKVVEFKQYKSSK